MATKKLVLIDAYNQIHRAYHALPELTTSNGVPTNATYGFTTMLRKLLDEEQPDYCAVVFDTPGKNVRHEAFADYKSSRPRMPDDLREQLPWVRQVVDAMGIRSVEHSDYEADDVIGTLARLAERSGVDTIIASEDKDLLQLVSDRIRLRSDRTQPVIYDREEVQRKFGVPPDRIADLLGLMGDSVDDIPGVPQIGKKRAQQVLSEYGSLEAALEHADEVADKGAWGRNLGEYADQARLSKELATVHTNLVLDVDMEGLEPQPADRQRCREIFTELEFRRLVDDFEDAPEESTGTYSVLADEAALERAVEQARETGRLAIVVQADRLEPIPAHAIGVGLSWGAESGVYVALGHAGLGAENTTTQARCFEILGPLLSDDGVSLLGHDLKPTSITLAHQHGIRLRANLDTMLASYVLHPTRSGHGLEALALDVLRIATPPVKDLLPDRKSSFADVPVPQAGEFVAARADLVLRLANAFEAELAAQPDLAKLLSDLEMPLMHVLAAMERYGVAIDSSYLGRLSAEFGERIEKLQTDIYEEAGRVFNLNSPKQLGEVLFDDLGLPAGRRTAKSGNRSTKAEVLEALAEEFPIVARILEYREIQKLKSTYLDALPTYVLPETGRVHAQFDQAVAATGRLSSSNPNLQNIPVRSATGRQIRKAFVPTRGYRLMTADYSQVELRIMAHLSGDPTLRQSFLDGTDIHRTTAAQIFHTPLNDVSYEQRDRAKVINFGVLYGMGPQRLAREFGVSLKEAKEFIERYLSAYPKVREFLHDTVEQAREDGYVTTLMGRIRHLPELQSGRPMIRAFGERIAVNTPIQGTAADLVKLAMVNLHRRLLDESLDAAMIVQVHDELVLEVAEDAVETVRACVREEMEGAFELAVPLAVDIGVGADWVEAKG